MQAVSRQEFMAGFDTTDAPRTKQVTVRSETIDEMSCMNRAYWLWRVYIDRKEG
jgi:hypothetical protein